MALITPSCVLCRKAEPTGSTCGEAAHLHESLKVCAHSFQPRTLCVRSLALRRTASPHPALTRRPRCSAGHYPQRHHTRRHRSTLSSTACIMLTGVALIISKLNGTTCSGPHATAARSTRSALLDVPVSCQVAVANSHAFACRCMPPPTRARVCTAVSGVVSRAVLT